MKKVLLSSLALIAVSSLAFGIYSFNKEKIYKDNEVNCDFDAGMCYDLKNKPITGRIQSYDKDKLISDIEYKNGQEDGLLKIYKTTGVLFLEGTYQNGRPHGYVKEYNEDGSLFSYDEFKNGLQHGSSIIYQKDGKILKEWHYTDGKDTGIGKVYYPNGALQLEINHDKGELKYFYETGLLNTLAHFDNTGYNGAWTIYAEDGKTTKAEIIYSKGTPQSGYCIDANNQTINFDTKAFEVFAKTNQTPCDTPQKAE